MTKPSMTPNRFSLVAAIGLALAALVTDLPALARADDLPELKLALADGTINPTPASVLQLAGTLGFYARHGVKVDIVELQGTPQAVAALNSGAVDLASIAIDSAIRLRADEDLPVRGIIALGIGSGFLVASRSDINTPADLVGKTFGIANRGSLDETLTQVMLTSAGVPVDGPNWVPIGPPSTRVQALAAGRIDATTVSFGTYLAIANEPGIKVLVTPEQLARSGPELTTFVAGLEPTLASKHDAVQRFTDALVDASRVLSANPDQWVTAMTEARDDLKMDNLGTTARFFARYWCVNGCMNKDMVAGTAAYIYSTPDFKQVKKLDYTDFVDRSFITKTLATEGPAIGSIDTP